MEHRTVSAFLVFIFLLAKASQAQTTGNFSANFVSSSGDASINVQVSMAAFNFDDPHGYWFTNPHNGDRYFSIQPDAGQGEADAIFMTIHTPSNTFELRAGDETNQLTLRSKKYLISAPEGGGLQVQVTTFTSSEIIFTIRGMGRYGTTDGNGKWLGMGKVEGRGHFYRDPRYAQSDELPGCDCDPVIYGTVYDGENRIRTTSGCEMALKNKISDAVQKSVASLFTNVCYTGSARPMPTGSITITPLAGHTDISLSLKPRPFCSSDYRTNSLTGMDAHKSMYIDEDSYGLQFIKMPSPEELNPLSKDGRPPQRKMATAMDSLSKLYKAGKITSQQMATAMNDIVKSANSVAQDFKKMDMEHTMKMWITINSFDKESVLVKLADKTRTVVQHRVTGAAFEIFTGQVRDSNGNWIPNRLAIYIGKFSAPLPGKSNGGYDALIPTIRWPEKANKLSVFGVIVRMEGGKEIMDKAVANIDFSSLQALINP